MEVIDLLECTSSYVCRFIFCVMLMIIILEMKYMTLLNYSIMPTIPIGKSHYVGFIGRIEYGNLLKRWTPLDAT